MRRKKLAACPIIIRPLIEMKSMPNCCDKCDSITFGRWSGKRYCGNPDCPCHHTPENPTKCKCGQPYTQHDANYCTENPVEEAIQVEK